MPSLHDFMQQLDSVGQCGFIRPFGLSVVSSTSPEGGVWLNQKLSHKRNRAVLDYLHLHSEVFRAIMASTECRIDERITNHQRQHTPLSNYPSMRYAQVILLLRSEAQPLERPLATVVLPNIEADYARSVSPVKIDTIALLPPAVGHVKPVLFVKTNLLYDLLTGVNLSVEVPLAKKLTVEATLVYPWWRNTAKHKTLQVRYEAVTPRYYFGKSDQPYTSFFTGLTVGAGKYDLQWTRRGVQGTLWHVSPVFGYSHHIAKNWKMEYAVSAGFIQTKYTKYTQTADTPYGDIKVKDYPWVSKVLNTVLPTSLNVSLVYTFTKTKKERGHERQE